MVEPWYPELSVRIQCELLGLSRSSYYYEPSRESQENLELMKAIDELHLKHPAYGSPRVTAWLRRHGWPVNRKRVVRLMRVMDIEAIYPRCHTSQPGTGHRVYPYLLKGLEITGPDQVWCADVTYVPMKRGFMYLVAVMDWWSRYVLAWKLSNTLESGFCVDALHAALGAGRKIPEIFNTDQGSQFTSDVFLNALEEVGAQISMDGKGRCMDNIFIERLWRSFKYEDIYLKGYETGPELFDGTANWFRDYNQDRPHQALEYATPADLYLSPENYLAWPAGSVWNNLTGRRKSEKRTVPKKTNGGRRERF
jgi:putative transposase